VSRQPSGPSRVVPRSFIRFVRARGIRLAPLADSVTIYLLHWAISLVAEAFKPGFHIGTHTARYTWTYGVIVCIHLAVFYFGGLYDRDDRIVVRPVAARMVWSVWLASLIVGLISWMLHEYLVPRSVLIVYAFIGPLVLGLEHAVAARLRLRRVGSPSVLLIGSPAETELVRREVHRTGDAVSVAGEVADLNCLEQAAASVPDLAGVLLVDRTSLDAMYTCDHLDRLDRSGRSALQIVWPEASLLGLGSIAEIAGMPFVRVSTHALTDSQVRLKRALDLAVLLVSLPVTLALGGFTALYTAVRAGRPLLFIQQRIGRDGEPFAMPKFRTMVPDAEASSGPVQSTVGDHRVVPGMRWIRQSRLDELPQLLSVLQGRMSIVGPRPVRAEELTEFEARYTGYRRRLHASPGITGLAQVYGNYYTNIEHKLGYDLHYLANWSPIRDLQIMLRSVWVILARRL